MTSVELLRKLKQVRGQAPDQPAVTPPEEMQFPYTNRSQADELETQAQPQRQMSRVNPGKAPGTGEQVLMQVLKGIQASSYPGGYSAMAAAEQATEHQRQQDLLGRAKQIRDRGFQEQQLNAQGENQRLSREQQTREFEAGQTQLGILNKRADRPQPVEISPGAAYGSRSPETGKTTIEGTIPKEPVQSEIDEDYVSYLTHPELTKKYGSDRTGFRKYQASQSQQGRVSVYGQTTAQNPSVIWGDDPEKPGKQKPYRYNESTRELEDIGITKTPVTAATKAEARINAKNYIAELKKISERLITNPTALAQRIEAIKRGGAAAVANDPDYRTYQDLRESLAATLAVAEQGARVSDYDVRGIYLPGVPDLFKDTSDSASMKWKLINIKMGDSNQAGAIELERGPDGKLRPKGSK